MLEWDFGLFLLGLTTANVLDRQEKEENVTGKGTESEKDYCEVGREMTDSEKGEVSEIVFTLNS